MSNGYSAWRDWDPRTHTVTVGKVQNKYKAEPTVLDGVRFDSKKECRRYQALVLRGLAGEIEDLELQPAFPLTVQGVIVATYFADFRYRDRQTRELITEDVKSAGTRTPIYRLKKRLTEVLYGITILET